MSRKEMNKTAAALEEKATKYDEILKYTLLDLSEEIVDKMIRPSKAFAQFSVSSVNENFFWRKVIFRHVSEHVIKAVVIEHTHEVEIVEKSSFKSQRCYFFTGQEVKNFQRASGLKPFVYKQTENRDTLITMIQPYGYTIKDCSQEIFNAQYGSLLKEKKWTAVNAKCSAQAGRLSTAYKALNPQLILVEKEEKLDIDGVSHFFFHVVVPDANSSRMVRFMNRSLFGDIRVLFLALLLVKGLQNALGLAFIWKRRRQSGQSDLGILCSVSDRFKSKMGCFNGTSRP
jgi:hypothetical protein